MVAMETTTPNLTSETFDRNIANFEAKSEAEQRLDLETLYELKGAELSFRGETVLAIGEAGIMATQMLKGEMMKTKQELEAEFDAALEEMRPLAESIIHKLLNGDESGLAGLPQGFTSALSERAATNRLEYSDKAIPQSEIDGMISVASIGLSKSKYGMDFGDF